LEKETRRGKRWALIKTGDGRRGVKKRLCSGERWGPVSKGNRPTGRERRRKNDLIKKIAIKGARNGHARGEKKGLTIAAARRGGGQMEKKEGAGMNIRKKKRKSGIASERKGKRKVFGPVIFGKGGEGAHFRKLVDRRKIEKEREK